MVTVKHCVPSAFAGSLCLCRYVEQSFWKVLALTRSRQRVRKACSSFWVCAASTCLVSPRRLYASFSWLGGDTTLTGRAGGAGLSATSSMISVKGVRAISISQTGLSQTELKQSHVIHHVLLLVRFCASVINIPSIKQWTPTLTRIWLRLFVSNMDNGAAVAALWCDGHNTLSFAGKSEGCQGASHHSSCSRWRLLWCFHVWKAWLGF